MKKIVLFFLGALMALVACETIEDESFDAQKKNSDESLTVYEKSIYKSPTLIIAEEMPEFPGGYEALRQFIINSVDYPESAKANGIEGKVFVSFVVEKDGTVGDARIVRSVSLSLDSEALRVVENLPNFKPGKQRGETVRVAFTVPINFALN